MNHVLCFLENLQEKSKQNSYFPSYTNTKECHIHFVQSNLHIQRNKKKINKQIHRPINKKNRSIQNRTCVLSNSQIYLTFDTNELAFD